MLFNKQASKQMARPQSSSVYNSSQKAGQVISAAEPITSSFYPESYATQKNTGGKERKPIAFYSGVAQPFS
jgi:hypothetical protein